MNACDQMNGLYRAANALENQADTVAAAFWAARATTINFHANLARRGLALPTPKGTTDNG